MRTAERLTEVISSGVAKLMDEHKITPPPPPSFWLALNKMIREELRQLDS